MIIRVETHYKKDKLLFDLCFKAKNLYNKANYHVRQEFINTSKEKEEGKRDHAIWLRYYDLYKLLKNEKEYKELPAQSSQSTLRLLEKNWKSFFKSIKVWKNNKEAYTGRPNLPKYKDKNGLKEVIYPGQGIFVKDGYLTLPKTKYKVKTKIKKENLRQLRLIPTNNKIKIEVVYEKETRDLKLNESRKIGIDIGVNNLMAITSNQRDIPTHLINGRPIKNINHYFNKMLAKAKSELEIKNKKKTSNKIQRLFFKRRCKIDDYLHKASRYLLDFCIENDIGEIIIGKNKNWKQKINIGKRNNQTFVQIPFDKLIEMIQYKAEEVGINVILQEESYTSKCDHLANESMEHHEKYLGKRIKRGLFKSSKGILLNADINGSIGILRKVIGNDFINRLNTGLVLNPFKSNTYFNKAFK